MAISEDGQVSGALPRGGAPRSHCSLVAFKKGFGGLFQRDQGRFLWQGADLAFCVLYHLHLRTCGHDTTFAVLPLLFSGFGLASWQDIPLDSCFVLLLLLVIRQ